MSQTFEIKPDNTAVRVALWRALHVLSDAEPLVLKDELGLKLANPPEDWQSRPDMSPFTKPFRASILARSRFVEDLVVAQKKNGILQYVILGAGLDTFAQRHSEWNTQGNSESTSQLQVYEIDQPGTQAWKKQRYTELAWQVPTFLKWVPVDFEAGEKWSEQVALAGFDLNQPAVISSLGVSMYLTQEAIEQKLKEIAKFAAGSILVMSFLVPLDDVDPSIRFGMERSIEGAKASGTPFLSFFKPQDILELAQNAGFKKVEHISSGELGQKYFANRSDGLSPPHHAEELLVAYC